MDAVGALESAHHATLLLASAPSAFWLPAASVKDALATEIEASPLKAGDSVKVAVRVNPVPNKSLSRPPTTAISALLKLVPGSSLKVNVKLADAPAGSWVLSLLMATKGSTVSTLNWLLATKAAWLSVAALPAVSRSALYAGRFNAFALTATPSASLSLGCTVYLNNKVSLPLPLS